MVLEAPAACAPPPHTQTCRRPRTPRDAAPPFLARPRSVPPLARRARCSGPRLAPCAFAPSRRRRRPLPPHTAHSSSLSPARSSAAGKPTASTPPTSGRIACSLLAHAHRVAVALSGARCPRRRFHIPHAQATYDLRSAQDHPPLPHRVVGYLALASLFKAPRRLAFRGTNTAEHLPCVPTHGAGARAARATLPDDPRLLRRLAVNFDPLNLAFEGSFPLLAPHFVRLSNRETQIKRGAVLQCFDAGTQQRTLTSHDPSSRRRRLSCAIRVDLRVLPGALTYNTPPSIHANTNTCLFAPNDWLLHLITARQIHIVRAQLSAAIKLLAHCVVTMQALALAALSPRACRLWLVPLGRCECRCIVTPLPDAAINRISSARPSRLPRLIFAATTQPIKSVPPYLRASSAPQLARDDAYHMAQTMPARLTHIDIRTRGALEAFPPSILIIPSSELSLFPPLHRGAEIQLDPPISESVRARYAYVRSGQPVFHPTTITSLISTQAVELPRPARSSASRRSTSTPFSQRGADAGCSGSTTVAPHALHAVSDARKSYYYSEIILRRGLPNLALDIHYLPVRGHYSCTRKACLECQWDSFAWANSSVKFSNAYLGVSRPALKDSQRSLYQLLPVDRLRLRWPISSSRVAPAASSDFTHGVRAVVLVPPASNDALLSPSRTRAPAHHAEDSALTPHAHRTRSTNTISRPLSLPTLLPRPPVYPQFLAPAFVPSHPPPQLRVLARAARAELPANPRVPVLARLRTLAEDRRYGPRRPSSAPRVPPRAGPIDAGAALVGRRSQRPWARWSRMAESTMRAPSRRAIRPALHVATADRRSAQIDGRCPSRRRHPTPSTLGPARSIVRARCALLSPPASTMRRARPTRMHTSPSLITTRSRNAREPGTVLASHVPSPTSPPLPPSSRSSDSAGYRLRACRKPCAPLLLHPAFARRSSVLVFTEPWALRLKALSAASAAAARRPHLPRLASTLLSRPSPLHPSPRCRPHYRASPKRRTACPVPLPPPSPAISTALSHLPSSMLLHTIAATSTACGQDSGWSIPIAVRACEYFWNTSEQDYYFLSTACAAATASKRWNQDCVWSILIAVRACEYFCNTSKQDSYFLSAAFAAATASKRWDQDCVWSILIAFRACEYVWNTSEQDSYFLSAACAAATASKRWDQDCVWSILIAVRACEYFCNTSKQDSYFLSTACAAATASKRWNQDCVWSILIAVRACEYFCNTSKQDYYFLSAACAAATASKRWDQDFVWSTLISVRACVVQVSSQAYTQEMTLVWASPHLLVMELRGKKGIMDIDVWTGFQPIGMKILGGAFPTEYFWNTSEQDSYFLSAAFAAATASKRWDQDFVWSILIAVRACVVQVSSQAYTPEMTLVWASPHLLVMELRGKKGIMDIDVWTGFQPIGMKYWYMPNSLIKHIFSTSGFWWQLVPQPQQTSSCAAATASKRWDQDCVWSILIAFRACEYFWNTSEQDYYFLSAACAAATASKRWDQDFVWSILIAVRACEYFWNTSEQDSYFLSAAFAAATASKRWDQDCVWSILEAVRACVVQVSSQAYTPEMTLVWASPHLLVMELRGKKGIMDIDVWTGFQPIGMKYWYMPNSLIKHIFSTSGFWWQLVPQPQQTSSCAAATASKRWDQDFVWSILIAVRACEYFWNTSEQDSYFLPAACAAATASKRWDQDCVWSILIAFRACEYFWNTSEQDYYFLSAACAAATASKRWDQDFVWSILIAVRACEYFWNTSEQDYYFLSAACAAATASKRWDQDFVWSTLISVRACVVQVSSQAYTQEMTLVWASPHLLVMELRGKKGIMDIDVWTGFQPIGMKILGGAFPTEYFWNTSEQDSYFLSAAFAAATASKRWDQDFVWSILIAVRACVVQVSSQAYTPEMTLVWASPHLLVMELRGKKGIMDIDVWTGFQPIGMKYWYMPNSLIKHIFSTSGFWWQLVPQPQQTSSPQGGTFPTEYFWNTSEQDSYFLSAACAAATASKRWDQDCVWSILIAVRACVVQVSSQAYTPEMTLVWASPHLLVMELRGKKGIMDIDVWTGFQPIGMKYWYMPNSLIKHIFSTSGFWWQLVPQPQQTSSPQGGTFPTEYFWNTSEQDSYFLSAAFVAATASKRWDQDFVWSILIAFRACEYFWNTSEQDYYFLSAPCAAATASKRWDQDFVWSILIAVRACEYFWNTSEQDSYFLSAAFAAATASKRWDQDCVWSILEAVRACVVQVSSQAYTPEMTLVWASPHLLVMELRGKKGIMDIDVWTGFQPIGMKYWYMPNSLIKHIFSTSGFWWQLVPQPQQTSSCAAATASKRWNQDCVWSILIAVRACEYFWNTSEQDSYFLPAACAAATASKRWNQDCVWSILIAFRACDYFWNTSEQDSYFLSAAFVAATASKRWDQDFVWSILIAVRACEYFWNTSEQDYYFLSAACAAATASKRWDQDFVWSILIAVRACEYFWNTSEQDSYFLSAAFAAATASKRWDQDCVWSILEAVRACVVQVSSQAYTPEMTLVWASPHLLVMELRGKKGIMDIDVWTGFQPIGMKYWYMPNSLIKHIFSTSGFWWQLVPQPQQTSSCAAATASKRWNQDCVWSILIAFRECDYFWNTSEQDSYFLSAAFVAATASKRWDQDFVWSILIAFRACEYFWNTSEQDYYFLSAPCAAATASKRWDQDFVWSILIAVRACEYFWNTSEQDSYFLSAAFAAATASKRWDQDCVWSILEAVRACVVQVSSQAYTPEMTLVWASPHLLVMELRGKKGIMDIDVWTGFQPIGMKYWYMPNSLIKHIFSTSGFWWQLVPQPQQTSSPQGGAFPTEYFWNTSEQDSYFLSAACAAATASKRWDQDCVWSILEAVRACVVRVSSQAYTPEMTLVWASPHLLVMELRGKKGIMDIDVWTGFQPIGMKYWYMPNSLIKHIFSTSGFWWQLLPQPQQTSSPQGGAFPTEYFWNTSEQDSYFLSAACAAATASKRWDQDCVWSILIALRACEYFWNTSEQDYYFLSAAFAAATASKRWDQDFVWSILIAVRACEYFWNTSEQDYYFLSAACAAATASKRWDQDFVWSTLISVRACVVQVSSQAYTPEMTLVWASPHLLVMELRGKKGIMDIDVWTGFQPIGMKYWYMPNSLIKHIFSTSGFWWQLVPQPQQTSSPQGGAFPTEYFWNTSEQDSYFLSAAFAAATASKRWDQDFVWSILIAVRACVVQVSSQAYTQEMTLVWASPHLLVMELRGKKGIMDIDVWTGFKPIGMKILGGAFPTEYFWNTSEQDSYFLSAACAAATASKRWDQDCVWSILIALRACEYFWNTSEQDYYFLSAAFAAATASKRWDQDFVWSILIAVRACEYFWNTSEQDYYFLSAACAAATASKRWDKDFVWSTLISVRACVVQVSSQAYTPEMTLVWASPHLLVMELRGKKGIMDIDVWTGFQPIGMKYWYMPNSLIKHIFSTSGFWWQLVPQPQQTSSPQGGAFPTEYFWNTSEQDSYFLSAAFAAATASKRWDQDFVWSILIAVRACVVQVSSQAYTQEMTLVWASPHLLVMELRGKKGIMDIDVWTGFKPIGMKILGGAFPTEYFWNTSEQDSYFLSAACAAATASKRWDQDCVWSILEAVRACVVRVSSQAYTPEMTLVWASPHLLVMELRGKKGIMDIDVWTGFQPIGMKYWYMPNSLIKHIFSTSGFWWQLLPQPQQTSSPQGGAFPTEYFWNTSEQDSYFLSAACAAATASKRWDQDCVWSILIALRACEYFWNTSEQDSYFLPAACAAATASKRWNQDCVWSILIAFRECEYFWNTSEQDSYFLPAACAAATASKRWDQDCVWSILKAFRASEYFWNTSEQDSYFLSAAFAAATASKRWDQDFVWSILIAVRACVVQVSSQAYTQEMTLVWASPHLLVMELRGKKGIMDIDVWNGFQPIGMKILGGAFPTEYFWNTSEQDSYFLSAACAAATASKRWDPDCVWSILIALRACEYFWNTSEQDYYFLSAPCAAATASKRWDQDFVWSILIAVRACEYFWNTSEQDYYFLSAACAAATASKRWDQDFVWSILIAVRACGLIFPVRRLCRSHSKQAVDQDCVWSILIALRACGPQAGAFPTEYVWNTSEQDSYFLSAAFAAATASKRWDQDFVWSILIAVRACVVQVSSQAYTQEMILVWASPHLLVMELWGKKGIMDIDVWTGFQPIGMKILHIFSTSGLWWQLVPQPQQTSCETKILSGAFSSLFEHVEMTLVWASPHLLVMELRGKKGIMDIDVWTGFQPIGMKILHIFSTSGLWWQLVPQPQQTSCETKILSGAFSSLFEHVDSYFLPAACAAATASKRWNQDCVWSILIAVRACVVQVSSQAYTQEMTLVWASPHLLVMELRGKKGIMDIDVWTGFQPIGMKILVYAKFFDQAYFQHQWFMVAVGAAATANKLILIAVRACEYFWNTSEQDYYFLSAACAAATASKRWDQDFVWSILIAVRACVVQVSSQAYTQAMTLVWASPHLLVMELRGKKGIMSGPGFNQ
ncbi:hypothetical protein B0H15DRAFT_803433 [Mycena belliarum]|uniref:Uncharacterized protein n=1 Tax=Mycena belliarum TaxID=1033014 RepID=A0AAD6U1Y8_9AGAR|nr:hypothetical protein B0H15DRAFT_803433 [Mycena belliae]